MRRKVSLKFPLFYDWLLNLFRYLKIKKGNEWKCRVRAPDDYFNPLILPSDEIGAGRAPICLFAIHWFSPSGAEYYALECARLAREEGFKIVWLVDFPTGEGGWEKEFMDISPNAILIWKEVSPISSIMERFRHSAGDVKAIHIHHSYFAYDHLDQLKSLFPEASVIDSTHIIEISDGGFPCRSLSAGDKIDIRNPISQGLSDYFEDHGVVRDSIFRTAITPPICNVEKVCNEVFSIGVIGRLSQQKRPYLIPFFLKSLDRCLREESFCSVVNFYIFGYGPYSKYLKSVPGFGRINICLKENCYDKDVIYGGLSCVLQLSENEGVSLVSYESASYCVPFVATDVGQQAEMVHPDMLLPRNPKQAVKKAAKIISDMIINREKYSYVVEWQKDRLIFLRDQYEYKDRMSHLYRRLLG